MNELKFLFEQIKIFEMKYDKLNETLVDKFNIFSILHKESDEVHLHSRFIYELLNPEGSHQQGDTFLKLFLKQVGMGALKENLSIYKEQNNIDILLKSKNKSIIIENKIYTKDHSNQLIRYINEMKRQGYIDRNIYLLYLTLFGEESNDKSLKGRVINISYEEDIINWLEESIKEVALIPSLRETLIQYLNLVKKLTNQSQYKGFILEVRDFLLKDDNLKRIISIEKSIVEAKIYIQLKFWEELIDNLQKYSFEFYNLNGDIELKKSVERYYKLGKNKKDYGIEYKIDENLYFFVELRENIYYGFYFEDENEIKKLQIDKLNTIKTKWEEVTSYIYWKYPEKNLNFMKFSSQNIFDLTHNDLREKHIKELSSDISYLIESYKQN